MPKKYQTEARTLLCAMPYAETQSACEALRAEFTTRYRKLAPKVENATALIWKILQVAESTFRKLKWAELLPAVYAGAQYTDGVQRSLCQQKKIAA